MRGPLPRGRPRSVDRGAYRRGIERRKQCSPGCRCCRGEQKATGAGPPSQGPSPPRVVFRPSACTYTSCAGTGISLSPPWEAAPGPHREGRRPSPMMNGAKKSDSLIVPAKPANKAGHPAAELVEGSSGTKRIANRRPAGATALALGPALIVGGRWRRGRPDGQIVEIERELSDVD